MDYDMIEIKVFYKNRGTRFFHWEGDKFDFDRYIKGSDGEFEPIEVSREHYTEVTKIVNGFTTFPDTRKEIVFNKVVHEFNMGDRVNQISDWIRSHSQGKSPIAHSSFSMGDIIQIGTQYFISTGGEFIEIKNF